MRFDLRSRKQGRIYCNFVEPAIKLAIASVTCDGYDRTVGKVALQPGPTHTKRHFRVPRPVRDIGCLGSDLHAIHIQPHSGSVVSPDDVLPNIQTGGTSRCGAYPGVSTNCSQPELPSSVVVYIEKIS